MPESLRLLSLIPAPGLEDLPLQLSGGAADDLLVTLTALWQPALIAAAESIPGWGRADQPPEAATPILAVVPPAAADRLPAGCEDRIRQAQGELWRADLGLERIAEEAIRRFGRLPAAGEDPELRDLAADFFALGFAYWQAQLLCRQQRHSWQLDDDPFRAAVVAAAVAWREANAAATRDGLQSAFDLLTQARIRHFPIDPHLVDLILTAPTTLDERLARNLAEPGPLNLLICGELAQRLASTRPEIAEQVRAHLADGSLSIVGGPEHEWPWQLFPLERLRAEIACGHDRYSAAFGQRPRIYGQRQYGLAAALPTLLSSFGYRGVLHASFDGSPLPDSGAPLAQWRAEDGSSVHAVWGPPLDAERGESFLGLSRRLGRALDSAHCAVAVLAHWPGRGSPWLRLLRRTAAYGRLLGRFVALEQLLEQLSAYGHHPIPEPQGYYVETWAEAANDRRWRPEVIAGHWRDHYQRLAAHGCDLMARLAGPCGAGGGDDAEPARSTSSLSSPLPHSAEPLLEAIAGACDERGPRLVLVNPLGFDRRVVCEVPAEFAAAPAASPIYAAAVAGGVGRLVVDLPSFGYVRIDRSDVRPRGRRREPSLVDGLTMQNEFFELRVDPASGGLRSLLVAGRRQTLVSQQLAIRVESPSGGGPTPRDGSSGAYTRMVADHIETVTADPVVGEIAARGRLIDGDRLMAEFRQSIRVVRGLRTFEIAIEIDPRPNDSGGDPWRHYVACRWAWPAESAGLSRAVHETRWKQVPARCEAPQYLEIDDANHRVALLTAGFPYHRVYDYRKLDTVLAACDGSAIRVRLGVGVDLPYPQLSAADGMSPPLIARTAAGPTSAQATAWMLRVDRRNVLVTAVEPLVAGEAAGVRVRLRETEGRAGKARIEVARPLQRALRTAGSGAALSTLPLVDGGAEFSVAARDDVQLDLYWKI